MDRNGYLKTHKIVGGLYEVYPKIEEGSPQQDARFVSFVYNKATDTPSSPRQELAAAAILNALTAAGLMEKHGDTDFSYGSDPQFRVLAISRTAIHFEDTNSRLY